jgi:hypothetical protein
MRDTCSIDRLHDYLERENYEMDPRGLTEVEAHLEQCPDCRSYLEDLTLLKGELAAMPLKALPDGFEEELHSRLVEEANVKLVSKSSRISNFTHSTSFKVLSGIAAVLIIAIVVVGTAGNPLRNLLSKAKLEEASSDMAMGGAPAPAEMPTAAMDRDGTVVFEESMSNAKGFGEPQSAPVEPSIPPDSTEGFDPSLFGKMIIRNGSVSLEVEEFDTAYAQVEEIVRSLEGYIEGADTYSTPIYDSNGRRGDLQGGTVNLRIPSTRFDAAMQQIKTLGTVTHSNISSYDVTENYVDTQSRIKNLEARELRLRELLDRAEDIEDIMEIDLQLANVRTEIDSLNAIIKSYDKSLQMSFIQVSLNEKPLSESTITTLDDNLFERMRANFIRSINAVVQMFQTIMVGLVAILPFLLIFGALMYLVLRLVRKFLRNRKQNL